MKQSVHGEIQEELPNLCQNGGKQFVESEGQDEKCLVSVVVCTYNRADLLVKVAIPSLLAQQSSSDCRYEILVIDNGSTDDTRNRILELALSTVYPRIRYFCETKIGLSHARNRGVAEAHGEIIAFFDDDVEAMPKWVQTVANAYERYADAWAVGGHTVPVYDAPKRPRWFQGVMFRFVGGHDLGLNERFLPRKLYLHGANMSFRRQTFDLFGGFRTELGRIGNKNLSHEEGEFFWRLHKAEKYIYYVPNALVYHHQPLERLRFRKLVGSCFFGGISESAVDLLHFGAFFASAKSGKKILMILSSLFLIPWHLVRWNWANAYYVFLRSVFGAGYFAGMIFQLIKGPILKVEVDGHNQNSVAVR